MNKENEYYELSVTTTKNILTINGCGKFNESKIHLNRTEASALLLAIYKWIEDNGK